ncbi:membrane-fusion protein [Serpentinimonas maccroryi]|uniref:Membrane-fusion protein n=2 Tax=Serpentinimonas maccroryi TaxID=1458426 RepID=A0A060NVM8_9BURK|nr:HlyD family efflux transporter periplasmic adaptor subunit [Serpentinimonas maccroryi]BAO83618.1 membrane-fusion protein [Serpentinimonas maccroryi]
MNFIFRAGMHNNALRWALALGFVAFIAAGSAWAAPGAHGPDGEHLDAPGAAARADGLLRLPDGSVQVPMASQRLMGFRTVLAQAAQVPQTTELPGRVVQDPNAGARVQSPLTGQIEAGPRGFALPGQRVRAGEVLAYVRHLPDPLAGASLQAQLAELRAAQTVAEQRWQRLSSLEGSVPRREIEAAQAEVYSLQARQQALSAGQRARVALRAPVGGVIARAEVLAGQVVEGREVLFEIVDPARLLVEASTADVALGQRIAAATLAGMPGVRLEPLGSGAALRDGLLPLLFRARQSPPSAGNATATAQLPLALGQPVTVIVQRTDTLQGFVLPAEAIVRNPANQPVLWIKSGAERYIPQPVQFRALDASTVVVHAGLGADNRVVVRGAALLAQIR